MIDEEQIRELSELIKKPIKEIKEEGRVTILEFEDGQHLPLYGGVAGLENLKTHIHTCSFCGSEGSKESPVVSLNEKDEPLICSNCASAAVTLFIQNGVELELDITGALSDELIESLTNKDK